MDVPIAWGVLATVAMIIVAVVVYRRLRCPFCGEGLGSFADKVCRACGAGLKDAPMSARPPGGPTPEVRAYMERSEQILQRWRRIRRRLRHAPWVAAAASTVALLVLIPTHAVEPSREDAFVAVFAGACVAGLTWLLLIHVVDNLFGILFSVFRGRCPSCRAWFTQRTFALPGGFVSELALPDFCPSCGEPLR